jgi:hypothetical protein
MTSWDDYRLTCVHGVVEGLDYHDCSECKERAIKKGLDWRFPDKTYIFTEEKGK